MKLRILLTLAATLAGCTATMSTGSTAPPPPVVRDQRPPPPPPRNEPPPPPPPAHAPAWDPTGWTMIGSATVNGKHDHDSIPVDPHYAKYSEITLVVTDSDLQLDDVVVHFGNGTSFAPKIKHTFREGQRARGIQLPGGERNLTRIDLVYSNIPGGGNARVEVYGKDIKGAPGAPPAAPPGPLWDSKGWTMFGSATVHGRTGKLDHDVIPVNKQQATELTLVVTDSDLELEDLVVVFGNKERYSPRLKQMFHEGQRTKAFGLPGNLRAIDHIELTYSNLPGGGNARVEVWGRVKK